MMRIQKQNSVFNQLEPDIKKNHFNFILFISILLFLNNPVYVLIFEKKEEINL